MVKDSLNSMYSKVLVTGASAGLGEGFVRMLLDEGLEVWGTSRRPRQLPERDRFHPVELDLRNADSLKDFLDNVLRQGPPFDLVVNNAGYGAFYPFDKFPENEIGGQIDVLLSGPIQICRQAYSGMHQRGHGVLVNVSSLAAEFPLPYMSLYNASKSGLSGFSQSLILESRGSGVTVIDFQPGDFTTSFNAKHPHSRLGLGGGKSTSFRRLGCDRKEAQERPAGRNCRPETAQSPTQTAKRNRSHGPVFPGCPVPIYDAIPATERHSVVHSPLLRHEIKLHPQVRSKRR